MKDVAKEYIRKLETTKVVSLRAVTGYRMADHRCNQDMRKELGRRDFNTIIGRCKK
jgi:hypothetical protein